MSVLTTEPTTRSNRVVIGLFALTAFVGAGMLFLVQPLVARMLLPSYGGSATVWSTASLFFQVMLLLGYLYTDRTTRLLGATRQRRVHAVVVLVPLALLPLALPDDAVPPDGSSPVLWLLRTLGVMVALPFLVLATTGPLVQTWYSWSGRPRAHDPYFLFAASNLGSFAGLLGYPFLLEPFLSLDDQLALWSWGFVLFVVLVGGCLTVRVAPAVEAPTQRRRVRVPRPQLLRWLGLSALPSGLLLSVTSYLSTDVAAIPLLWVVPLAIYLATFVIAFARTSRTPPVMLTRLGVAVALAAAVSAVTPVLGPVRLALPLQLGMLALVAYAAHARLAADRPEPEALTRFYLVIAVGGALGGLLNGVVAPLVFDRVLEHGLLLACVPLLLLGLSGADRRDPELKRRERVFALGVAVLALVPLALASATGRVPEGAPLIAVGLAAVVLLGWALTGFPRVFLVAMVVLQLTVVVAGDQNVIERTRTFYGSYLVKDSGELHTLEHGTTVHGTQFLDAERRRTPTTYYAPTGPLGDVFDRDGLRDVAVVGLGAGTVAAYGEAGDDYTFYEIDQAVVDMARDPRLFTYLADTPARVRTVVGDGRLGLAAEPEESFDLVVLDAFSSDSIPVHLLTVEAMRTYAERLRPGGLLAVHISNRVFDLRPVVRGAADELGWVGVVGTKGDGGEDGATLSKWVLLAATPEDLGDLPSRPGWSPLPGESRLWTDDYSSVLPLLR